MIRRACVVGCLLSFLAGCPITRKNPLACQDGVCIDPDRPYCDSDGSIEGTPNACIALTCTPGELLACSKAGSALTCSASGDDTNATACPFGCDPVSGCIGTACMGDDLVTPAGTETCLAGCVSSPTPHCTHIVPRYLPDVCDTPAEAEILTFNGMNNTIDVSADGTCNGGIVNQGANAPAICVVRYRRITIPTGTSVVIRVTGDIRGRAVALVADDEISIDGTLDVSGAPFDDPDGPRSGPGGGFTTSGGPASDTVGGGGAGFATPGNSGGTLANDGAAANLGPSGIDPSTLDILLGGPAATQSGGGGGAVTAISCRGTLRVGANATINAGGGGGSPGFKFGLAPRGGGGGGAGGYVSFQAASPVVLGSVFANGGSGGGGMTSNATAGTFGRSGRAALSAAPGGAASGGSGAGGAGAVLGVLPTVGTHPTIAGATPGGGGGGLGFLQVFAPAGVIPDVNPAAASPSFSSTKAIGTR